MKLTEGFIAMFATMSLIGSCVACAVLPPDEDCTEPTKHQMISTNDFAEAVYSQTKSLLPGWRNTEKKLEDIPSVFQAIQREHFSGHFNCNALANPKAVTTGKSRNKKHSINQVALCPWMFVKNIDTNRKPEVFIESLCACDFPSSDYPDLFCENVYQYVTVFRRTGCINGVFEYEKITEKFSVGCVTVTVPRPSKAKRKNRQRVMGQK